VKAPVRLLIAEDHPIVRAGFEGMLAEKSDLEVAGAAENGEEAVHLAALLRPDVILMDLRMPEMDGVEAISRIKEDHPHVHVLTTYDSDADILRAIEAGATGYLLKDAPREELFRAIRAAAHGEPVLDPSVSGAPDAEGADTGPDGPERQGDRGFRTGGAQQEQQGDGEGPPPQRGHREVAPDPHLRQARCRRPYRRRYRRSGKRYPTPAKSVTPRSPVSARSVHQFSGQRC
jgi:CheY-like chemotaxis protein